MPVSSRIIFPAVELKDISVIGYVDFHNYNLHILEILSEADSSCQQGKANVIEAPYISFMILQL